MKRQIAVFFLVASFCFILFAWTVPAKNRVVIKNYTLYINEKRQIKINPKLKIKKIKKTNPKLDIKKQKNNVIVVEPLDMDKSELTVYTNKQTYRYVFKVKERYQIENEKLEKYIKKKNPKRIIFTNKVNKKAKIKLSSSSQKSVVGWMKNDTLYISANNGGRVYCYDADSLFSNLQDVEYIDVSYLDISKCTTATYMFAFSPKLKQIKGLNRLDFSHIKNMCALFTGCKSLEELDVTGWNTERVTDMGAVFMNCYNLKTIRGLETWNTSNVRYMTSMFSYGVSYSHNGKLKNINLSTWDVSKVKDMSDMFYGCGSLEYLNVSGWNTKNLKSADHMFCQCVSLKNLDVSKWNVSKVLDFNAMFHSCSSLTYIDVSKWDTSSAIYMCQMFEMCTSLKQLDVSHFNTDKVIGFCEMFKDCRNLEELDLSSFSTKSVPAGECIRGKGEYFRCCSGMKDMFKNCSSLKMFGFAGA